MYTKIIKIVGRNQPDNNIIVTVHNEDSVKLIKLFYDHDIILDYALLEDSLLDTNDYDDK